MKVKELIKRLSQLSIKDQELNIKISSEIGEYTLSSRDIDDDIIIGVDPRGLDASIHLFLK